MDVIAVLLDLGASVVLPVFIFLIGLILKVKPGQAFRAGLTVGIGFVGINLVINLLVESLGPAAKDMVKQWGLDLNIIDVGWPATSAIAFGSAVGALAIPIGLLVNLGMLLFGLTRTLNIDMWNLWHIAFTGALVTIMTDDFVLGVLTAIVHAILLLVLGDLSAKHISDYYGYQNITFPHGTSAPYYLIALPLEKLFNRIPGFRDWKADPETIQKRLGIFGESTVLGLILGILIGFLAGWEAEEVLGLGVKTAAVMLLLPRMVALLMEGLIPISEAAEQFVRKRFPGRELYIGMDSALAVGHPAAIAASLIMVPIVLAMAVIVPGNQVLPFGDLATIPFIVCMMVPIFRGNVIRTVIGATVSLAFGLLLATSIAPLFTTAAKNAGFDMPAGAAAVSSLVDGAVPTTAIFIFGAKLGYAGIIGIGALTLAAAYLLNRRRSLAEPKGQAMDG
jgi:galactitol PTS system EIIC component